MPAASEVTTELEGLLVVNKPAGPTSHDVVQSVKKSLGVRKAGHLGTLDPMAEGVLVICLGEATKIAPFLSDQDKEYEGTVLLGAETDTWDADGEIVARKDPSGIIEKDVEEILADMKGLINLEAPPYSAIKQGGEPLYRKARRGEKVDAPVRTLHIYEIELKGYRAPRAEIRCVVSPGAYIRSIARELGKRLGVGAHLEKLKRTRSGNFRIEDAFDPADLQSRDCCSRVEEKLVQLRDALGDMPELIIDAEVALGIRNGIPISPGHLESGKVKLIGGDSEELFKAVDLNGNLVAVMKKARGKDETDIWKSVRVWKRKDNNKEVQ